jgi:hypothetical protein
VTAESLADRVDRLETMVAVLIETVSGLSEEMYGYSVRAGVGSLTDVGHKHLEAALERTYHEAMVKLPDALELGAARA